MRALPAARSHILGNRSIILRSCTSYVLHMPKLRSSPDMRSKTTGFNRKVRAACSRQHQCPQCPDSDGAQEWWGVTEEVLSDAEYISRQANYRVLVPDLCE